MIHSQNAESLDPVQQSAGFSSALQKFLPAIRRNALAFCCVVATLSPIGAEGGKFSKVSKEKHLGQIFTPNYLVCDILDIAGYKVKSSILGKHVIDNSCGDGAFLTEVARRYCTVAQRVKRRPVDLKKDLETFIHGIELDEQAYLACLSKLNDVAATFSLHNVAWDVQHANTLDVAEYDGKMDYVVGNPPYVRVHNLEGNFTRVKQYQFCTGGMTDLYLVFYELGLRMLKDGGRLCYIAPSSWFNSLAGHNMREYVKNTGYLREIVDLGHFQPFAATTYTAIVLLEKSPQRDFSYKSYDGQGQIRDVARLTFEDCCFDDAIYLGEAAAVAECRKIKTGNWTEKVDVKNGFATLADDVFIADAFPFSEFVIPVVKASTGKWRNAFYPYDSAGKPIAKERIFANKDVASYMESRKEELLKGQSEAQNPNWHLYGRSQALKDVWVEKFAINTVVRDKTSIKFTRVPAGSGLYSGLYVLSELPGDKIKAALLSDAFIAYIRVLRKYKSGGYYTFSSKDVRQFLNYKLRDEEPTCPQPASEQMELDLR